VRQLARQGQLILLAGLALIVTGSLAAVAQAGPGAVYQPDAQIRRSIDADFVGNDVYNDDGTGQTLGWKARRGHARKFTLLFQNDGNASDTFTIHGCGSSHRASVKYVYNDDVTDQVVAGTFEIPEAPGGANGLGLKMTVGDHANIGAIKSCLVTATSQGDPSKLDAVKAKLRVIG
jgi:hypothetical protein